MFFDAALIYEHETRRCDLDIGDDGDLVIDETPVTPMLLSIGLDRRAEPDDPLPQGRTRFLTPAHFSELRGCPGDALDANGERTGSRLWLLERAKRTETTRLLVEFWLREALSWAVEESGRPAEIDVAWLDGSPETGRLGYRCMIDDTSVSLSRTL